MADALPSRREMIAALIGEDTVSCRCNPELDGSNRPVLDRLADWARQCGFRVRIDDVPGKPGKYNLIATLGDGPGGLALGGHADTVPWDANRWTTDPFRALEHEGRLYGLGSCDMKSFLVLALEAAARFSGRALTRPVHLVVTADEECDMAGARALAASDDFRPEAAVIGEPTRLRPVRMHKGQLMERLRITGRSGHSSDPSLGNSALEGMHDAIGALRGIRDELQASHRHEAFRVPVPTLNLGQIRGGDSPNRICGECELGYDLRVLPGMDMAATREAVRQRVRDTLTGRGLAVRFEALFEGTPPAETAADAAIVRAAEDLTGEPARAVAFGTEAAFYQRLGMDVLVLGPGNIDQAHQPDEFVELADLDRTLGLLSGLIERFCVGQPPLTRHAG
jgi:acetylornithine deacetylase